MITNAENTWRAAFAHVGRRLVFLLFVTSGIAVGWNLGGPPGSAVGAGIAAYLASFILASKGASR